jgi:hypothetical protein
MTPRFFLLLSEELFGVRQTLAHRLWTRLHPSPTFLYQLARCDVNDAAKPEWIDRARRLLDLLPPALLLAASLDCAPETRRPRAREITDFEETVLKLVDREGRWRW